MPRGTHIKERWSNAAAIGDFLLIDKRKVYNALGALKKEHLFEPLLYRAEEARAKSIELIEKVAAKREPELPLFEEDKKDLIAIETAKDINLAFWFIKKVGSVDRAERLLRIAKKCISEVAG